MTSPQPALTACLICAAPLGHDSREEQHGLCHTCRKCSACGLPIGPRECAAAVKECLESFDTLDRLKELIQHPRCQKRLTANEDPSILVRQTYLDWLNNIRLLIEPNLDLNRETNEQDADIKCGPWIATMTLEQQFIALARHQAIVAHLSIAVNKNPEAVKIARTALTAKQAAKAKVQSITSSRPVAAPIADAEVILGEFMRLNGITERKVGLQMWRNRNKAVDGLMATGMSKRDAEEMTDRMMSQKRGPAPEPTQ